MTVGKLNRILLLAVVSATLTLGFSLTGLLAGFEHRAYDLFSKQLNPEKSPGDIVIVQIDQNSIDAASGQGVNWPWPRQMYLPLIEYMSQADAVLMDIVFSEPSSYGNDDDRTLAEAMGKAGNVYLPFVLSKGDRSLASEGKRFLESQSVPGMDAVAPGYVSATVPIEQLRVRAAGSGNVAIDPDNDGVYRRVPLFSRMGGLILPNLFTAYIVKHGDRTIVEHESRIASRNGGLLLRFYRGKDAFPKLSAIDVINAYIGGSGAVAGAPERSYFKGKKVFVGLTAAGLYDLKPNAVSSLSTGVTVHATAMDNMLSGGYIKPVWFGIGAALVAFVSLAATGFVMRYHTLVRNVLLMVCGLAVTAGVPALLFKAGYYLEIIPPSMALVIAFVVTSAYSYATEGRERRFIRKTFSQYMDDKIVSHVLEHPELIRPGGVRKRVTVFFADIAGFTTISEQLPAEETALILHTVLNGFTEVIIRNSGTIDKYIGDCVMAFWGAPLSTKNDALNACRAAVECMDELERINGRFREQGLSPISMRIGIHTGDAIAGNLGSDRLFDYTVIGDTVNTASRLESVNKVFKTRIIVSGETFSETKGVFFSRDLGLIEVKGKSVPLRIYELIADAGKISEDRRAVVDLYEKAMERFNNGELDACSERLRSLLETYPDDGPSLFYLNRAEDPEMKKLTENWNVIKMTEK